MATIANTPLHIGQGGILAGTNYSGALIPTLWSSKILQAFYAESIYDHISNTDYEGEIKNFGDTVRINKSPKVTISDYVVGSGFVDTLAQHEQVDLLIDRAKHFSIPLFDVVEKQSLIPLMTQYSKEAAQAMQDAINADILVGTSARPGIFNDVAAANTGATAGKKTGAYKLGTAAVPLTLGTAAGNSDPMDVILSLAAVLDEQDIPSNDRWLLIDSATRLQLYSSKILQSYLQADAKQTFPANQIGLIDRFMTFVTNKLPLVSADGQNYYGGTTTGTKKHRVILAGHKSALTFAAQIAKTETKEMPNDFGKKLVGLSVYGFKVLRPHGLAAAYVL